MRTTIWTVFERRPDEGFFHMITKFGETFRPPSTAPVAPFLNYRDPIHVADPRWSSARRGFSITVINQLSGHNAFWTNISDPLFCDKHSAWIHENAERRKGQDAMAWYAGYVLGADSRRKLLSELGQRLLRSKESGSDHFQRFPKNSDKIVPACLYFDGTAALDLESRHNRTLRMFKDTVGS
jgi:hypothetical protein